MIPNAPLEVAVIQLNAQDDVDQNLETIVSLGKRAKSRVLCLPEGCAIMGEPDKKRVSAEPVPKTGSRPSNGKVLTTLSTLAREESAYVFAGGIALQSGDHARPYNAHTTASDALWCGLPVLTCPGETFASRVAGSLLRVAHGAGDVEGDVVGQQLVVPVREEQDDQREHERGGDRKRDLVRESSPEQQHRRTAQRLDERVTPGDPCRAMRAPSA